MDRDKRRVQSKNVCILALERQPKENVFANYFATF